MAQGSYETKVKIASKKLWITGAERKVIANKSVAYPHVGNLITVVGSKSC